MNTSDTVTITNTIRVASFDIGVKNFAFCVEEINLDEMTQIYLLKKSLEREEILRQVYKIGKIILLENLDISVAVSNEQNLYVNMFKVLDKYAMWWDTCSIVIIEQQMKINIKASKIAQHLYSYFIFKYAGFKILNNFASSNKTRILGAPKKQTKKQRKQWSVDKALEILNVRGDVENIEKIQTAKKKDDLGDVITQLQAYKYMNLI